MKQALKFLSPVARIAILFPLAFLSLALWMAVAAAISLPGGYAIGYGAFMLFGRLGFFGGNIEDQRLFAGLIGLIAIVSIPPIIWGLLGLLGDFLRSRPSVQKLETAFRGTAFGCWLLEIEPPPAPVAPPQQGCFRTNAKDVLDR